MELICNLNLPDGEAYAIEVNGITKEVSAPENKAVFELADEGEYIMSIEQKPAGFLFKPFVSWLVFVLTAVIRGIFHIATLSLPFSEGLYGEKWWSDVRPYRLRAKTKVLVKGDTSITINISNTKFDSKENLWIPPSAALASGEILETELIKNDYDFKLQYIKYARAAVSVGSVGLILFTAGLVSGLKRSNSLFAILCGILIAVCIAICVMVLFSERKRMKKLIKSAYGDEVI